MNLTRKKAIISIIAIALLFLIASRFSKKQTTVAQEKPKALPTVTLKKASDSLMLTQTIQYPGLIVGDDEIKVTAKIAGTLTGISYSLGNYVGAGALLATIDDTGNNLSAGDEGLQSSQVQQSGLNVDQLKQALDNAKKSAKNLENAYDNQQKNSSLPQTVTKSQVDAARGQVDIADIQYKSAKVGFKSSIDSHRITSPISGYVTSKPVSAGDSVSQGQLLATISKTKSLKVQFYVDQTQMESLKKGMAVNIITAQDKLISTTVRNISPIADPITKRFLIEAYPTAKQNEALYSGTVVSVSFEVTKKTSQPDSLILPLSAITVGQNESYIFIANQDKAKKIQVKIESVDGETAQISGPISSENEIIITGNKLLRDGDQIIISQ